MLFLLDILKIIKWFDGENVVYIFLEVFDGMVSGF